MKVPAKTEPGIRMRPVATEEVDIKSLELELRERIEGEVRFSPGDRALYSATGANYRQLPLGVVIPRTVDDVLETVAACREHGASLLSRGGGTGLAGQTTNVAVVLTVAVGCRTVETARKSAVSRVRSSVHRTYPRWLSKNRSCGFFAGGVNCVCSTNGSPSELIDVPRSSVAIVGEFGSPKSFFRS